MKQIIFLTFPQKGKLNCGLRKLSLSSQSFPEHIKGSMSLSIIRCIRLKLVGFSFALKLNFSLKQFPQKSRKNFPLLFKILIDKFTTKLIFLENFFFDNLIQYFYFFLPMKTDQFWHLKFQV